MQDQDALLRLGLDRHKVHGRQQRRLRNRLGSIILLAFQERFDVMRRDQSNPVPVAGQFPRPVMGSWTRLHCHLARRMLRHEPSVHIYNVDMSEFGGLLVQYPQPFTIIL